MPPGAGWPTGEVTGGLTLLSLRLAVLEPSSWVAGLLLLRLGGPSNDMGMGEYLRAGGPASILQEVEQ